MLGLIRHNDFLVSTLVPLLTGKPPLDDIIDQLAVLPSGAGVADSLRNIRHQLLELEKKGLVWNRGEYEAITSEIEKLRQKRPGKAFRST